MANITEFAEIESERRAAITELMASMSPQQIQFCIEFVRTLNPAVAARKAIGETKPDGTPYTDFPTRGRSFLLNTRVKELIAYLMENQISKDEVMARLVEIARFDYGELLTTDDEGRAVFDLARAKEAGLTGVIKAFSYGKQGVRVEVYDKLAALNTLAKVLGMLNDDAPIGKNTGFKVLVEHVRKEIGEDIKREA